VCNNEGKNNTSKYINHRKQIDLLYFQVSIDNEEIVITDAKCMCVIEKNPHKKIKEKI